MRDRGVRRLWLRSWWPWPRACRVLTTSTRYRRGEIVGFDAKLYVVTHQSKWVDPFGASPVYGRRLER